MTQGRAHPLFATDSGLDVTDRLEPVNQNIRSVPVYDPEAILLLRGIIERLDLLIELQSSLEGK